MKKSRSQVFSTARFTPNIFSICKRKKIYFILLNLSFQKTELWEFKLSPVKFEERLNNVQNEQHKTLIFEREIVCECNSTRWKGNWKFFFIRREKLILNVTSSKSSNVDEKFDVGLKFLSWKITATNLAVLHIYGVLIFFQISQ